MQTNFDTDKFKDFKFYGLPNVGNTSSFNIRISEKDRTAKQDILTNGTAIKSNGKNLFFAIRIANKYTCDNLTIKPMLVPANYEYNKYIQNEQTDYILNIQQEMLQNDYFVKEEDGWKEVHGYVNKKLNSTDSWSLVNSSENSFKFRLETYLKFSDYNEKCTHFKTGKSYWNTDEEGCYIGTDNRLVISIPKNNNYNVTDLETFKTLLSTIDATLYYYNTTLTKLSCTEEQSAVLDKLNNLDLFKNTNNIITTEDIALLKLKYVVDTKTYIDNQIADMQNQLNTINELLSTTATSSILLDNLQTDLESEVM